MAIGFSNIPADIRVPLFYAEMDNSAANSASSVMRRLIVAQVNDNIAPADVGKLVLVSSVALAKSIGGQGSMLASMLATDRAKNAPCTAENGGSTGACDGAVVTRSSNIESEASSSFMT